MKKIFYLFTILLLFSCTIKYPEDVDSSDKIVPKTVLKNAKITSINKGRIFYTAEMGRAMTFDETNITEVEDMKFFQYDKNGEITAEGYADKAKVKTSNNNAEIFDNIYIYAKEEETAIQADYLNWENDKKMLTSAKENTSTHKDKDIVTVTKDDGTKIMGKGFSANLNERLIEFTGSVEGVIVTEKGQSDE